MNLVELHTTTTVQFDPSQKQDCFLLNGEEGTPDALARVSAMLDRVRQAAEISNYARVESANNFPVGAGIASSASAFAALALAASTAAGLELTERELSALARTGSGSASRSVPGGYVEWLPGKDHESSYAVTIATADHWNLVDNIAIISHEHKAVGSTAGHRLADTSPIQQARIADSPRRLDICRDAILERDFDALAEVVEQDSNLMHAVMMTSNPPLLYWLPPTVSIMHAVRKWRGEGLQVCYTIDAGPNVHVLSPASDAHEVAHRLREIAGVEQILSSSPGGPAHLVS